MNINFESNGEQLLFEINSLKRLVFEPEFGQYLCNLEASYIANPQNAEMFRSDLYRCYNIYSQRMVAVGKNIPDDFFTAAYPGMGKPVVLNNNSNIGYNQFYAAQAQMNPLMNGTGVQPAQTVFSQPQKTNQPQQTNQSQQTANVAAMVNNMADNPAMATQIQNQSVLAQPTVAQSASVVMMQQNTNHAQLKTAAPEPVPEKKVNGSKAEFAIGGILLSIFGTVIILIAAIMLAINFMDSFMQGVSMYIVCAAILAFSEFFIRKRIEKLSGIFTGLALAGLYVSTLVNFFALHNFGFVLTLVILVLLTISIGVLSFFRKSFLLTIIGFVSSFVVLGLSGSVESEMQMFFLLGTVIIVCCLWSIIPVTGNGKAFGIVQMYTYFFMPYAFIIAISASDVVDDPFLVTLFLAISILPALITLVNCSVRYYGEKKSQKGGAFIAFVIGFLSLFFSVGIMDSIAAFEEIGHLSIVITTILVTLISCGFVAGWLKLLKNDMWVYPVYLASAILLPLCFAFEDNIAKVSALVILVAIHVGLSRLLKTIGFKICDVIGKCALFIAIMVYAIIQWSNNDFNVAPLVILLASELIITMIGSGFADANAYIMTLSIIMAIAGFLRDEFVIIPFFVVPAVLMFVFNFVEYLKPKSKIGYNIFALVCLVVAGLFVNIPEIKDNGIVVFICFACGLLTMIQVTIPAYGMPFAKNVMPLALYLSYFVFMIRGASDYVTSAILMFIALFCVGAGFFFKQKACRIYGLVLSIFVCGKLVFYDFSDATTGTKTIMYFVCGIITLAISSIYIIIEKKMSNSNK